MDVDSTLAVSPADYLVGDAFPTTGDNAALFGDEALNTLDLIFALRAVTNVPGFRPAACADRYDAMDSFPADATTRGGDGLLTTLDLIITSRRVTNVDPARPLRTLRGLPCPAPGFAP